MLFRGTDELGNAGEVAEREAGEGTCFCGLRGEVFFADDREPGLDFYARVECAFEDLIVYQIRLDVGWLRREKKKRSYIPLGRKR